MEGGGLKTINGLSKSLLINFHLPLNCIYSQNKIPKTPVCIRCVSSPTRFLSVVCWSEDFHATSTVGVWHMGQPFTSVVLGWVPISSDVKPPLLSEHQLSARQKDSEEEPLAEMLFSLLFYFFSFIKSARA